MPEAAALQCLTCILIGGVSFLWFHHAYNAETVFLYPVVPMLLFIVLVCIIAFGTTAAAAAFLRTVTPGLLGYFWGIAAGIARERQNGYIVTVFHFLPPGIEDLLEDFYSDDEDDGE